MNFLTYDIEGFFEACQDIMDVPPELISDPREEKAIDLNTRKILDMLAAADQKATFFILGRLARDMKPLVRSIADQGHEIACHSFEHRRLFNFTASEARGFLADAKHFLEDTSGQRVRGFRAPDFSITEKNRWAFDVLKEVGFDYDSSVYPTSLHDVYGISDFPVRPFKMENGLIEVPMSSLQWGKHNIPFGGGGYFRLYPYFLTRWAYRRNNRKGIPCNFYLHPYEMGELPPDGKYFGTTRKFRTFVGIQRAHKKMARLMNHFEFGRIDDYLKQSSLIQ